MPPFAVLEKYYNAGRSKEKKRKDEDEDYVESKLSKSIIQQARLQVSHKGYLNTQKFTTVTTVQFFNPRSLFWADVF